MRRCIDSLLPGGTDVEILIINDGSSDDTAVIAEEYRDRYPDIVRVFHQANGGHGEAINTGVRNAGGCYIKIVDSDDWVDLQAYQRILSALKEFADGGALVDLLVSNYVYEKEGKQYKTVVRYANALPEGRVITWEEIGQLRKGQYFLMHSLIYRTEILRTCDLRLPRHTFYVDNLYAYLPLPSVRRLYYLNVEFYRYYIGREDQSVHEAQMIKRIDQQILVNRMMMDGIDFSAVSSENLRNYLMHYLEIVTVVSSVLLIRSKSRENLRKKEELWGYLKQYHYPIYKQIRYGSLGHLVNLPGRLGRRITTSVYRFSRTIVGFS
jgi:glycosyltransferase involved in cell wall biosynthesis